MRKLLLVLVVGIMGIGNGLGQTIITQWNFNNTFADISSNGNCPAPSTGTGTMTLVGNTTGDQLAGVGADQGIPNNGLNTKAYPAQGANAKTAGIRFSVNTSGYNSIHVKFYVRQTNTAAKKVLLQYFNGISWQDAGFYNATSGGNFSAQVDLDLAAYSTVNNSSSAQFQIVTDFSSPTNYDPANAGSTYSASTGMIRYDLVTVTGNTTTCTGTPTIQASDLILTKTDATSMNLAFKRGNGGGCIILAKAGSAVDFTPASGMQYTANAAFGSGTQLGTGNYVVANSIIPGTRQVTLTGLTAGTKYFFAVYEYSATGFCYLTPGFTYSAYCNSTVLFPGDMLIVGFDAHVAANGVDKYYLTNLVDIKNGTTFSLVNSRFEAGALANSRTNRWRGPGTAPYRDPDMVKFTYTAATPILKGSIISFEFNTDAINLQINGATASSLFDIPIDNHNLTGGFISTSGADQIFLVSGYFSPFGTDDIDKYNTLTGNPLCGITNGIPWVPFSTGVSEAGIRESRIPPQINCISLQLSAAINGFGYYRPAVSHTGTKAEIIGRFTNITSWQYGAGLDNVNDAIAATTPFFINTSNPDGQWNGTANTDWFNCSNWEGLRVPEFATAVTIPNTPNKPEINNANLAFKAAEYERYAVTESLNIDAGASVSLKGTANDRLFTFGPLTIANTGSLQFENGTDADTLYLKNNLTNNGSGLITGTGTVFLDNNFSNTTTQLSSLSSLTFNNLAMANTYGASVNNNLVVNGQLRLANGIFNMGSNIFRINKTGNIAANSFDNFYQEWMNGWDGSFINGKLEREMEGSNIQRFPIGKVINGIPIFAPCAVSPDSTDLRVYSGEYFPTTSVDKSNVRGPIDHISDLEYWEIWPVFTTTTKKDAIIQLSWRPNSNVTTAVLDSLLIAHYFNDGVSTAWSSEANITLPGNYIKSKYGNYGTIQQSNFFASKFDPLFTFATRSKDQVLPVQLLSFLATPQNKTIKLDWQVLDEKDALSYTIEKSTDARNFSFMQKVAATANVGVGNYTATDATPANGWNYYRLLITNKQGKTTTSKTERAWMGGMRQLLVYPNPATDFLKIVLPDANATASLIDASGKTVWTSNKPGQQTFSIDVKRLPRGIYLLHYYSLGALSTQKIILQ